jgi:hypothetical protein
MVYGTPVDANAANGPGLNAYGLGGYNNAYGGQHDASTTTSGTLTVKKKDDRPKTNATKAPDSTTTTDSTNKPNTNEPNTNPPNTGTAVGAAAGMALIGGFFTAIGNFCFTSFDSIEDCCCGCTQGCCQD